MTAAAMKWHEAVMERAPIPKISHLENLLHQACKEHGQQGQSWERNFTGKRKEATP